MFCLSECRSLKQAADKHCPNGNAIDCRTLRRSTCRTRKIKYTEHTWTESQPLSFHWCQLMWHILSSLSWQSVSVGARCMGRLNIWHWRSKGVTWSSKHIRRLIAYYKPMAVWCCLSVSHPRTSADRLIKTLMMELVQSMVWSSL
jgi:hypothetical protein